MNKPPHQPGFVPLTSYREYPVDEMVRRSRNFAEEMQRRRTVRQFSERPVPRSVIEACIEAAGTAPSGAHQQPWHFAVVSDPSGSPRWPRSERMSANHTSSAHRI
jgi:iodotyrosine deiodinase